MGRERRRWAALLQLFTDISAAVNAVLIPTSQPPEQPAVKLLTWAISQLTMTAGTPYTFDLNTTLPASVRRGGTFIVDSSGAALPAGALLSPSGVLSVSAQAHEGLTQGIVFAYIV